MIEAPGTNEIVVSSPARAEYLHVVRSVVASVASRAKLSFDAVEDLRLAVGEAGGILLGVSGVTTLTLRVEAHGDRLDIGFEADASTQPWPSPAVQSSVSWSVLSALVDDLRAETRPGCTGLRFVKRMVDAPQGS